MACHVAKPRDLAAERHDFLSCVPGLAPDLASWTKTARTHEDAAQLRARCAEDYQRGPDSLLRDQCLNARGEELKRAEQLARWL